MVEAVTSKAILGEDGSDISIELNLFSKQRRTSN